MKDPAWEFMRIAMASPARTAIMPMQDVLRLDERARMNTPATIGNNWRWRMQVDYANGGLARQLAQLTAEHCRTPVSGDVTG